MANDSVFSQHAHTQSHFSSTAHHPPSIAPAAPRMKRPRLQALGHLEAGRIVIEQWGEKRANKPAGR